MKNSRIVIGRTLGAAAAAALVISTRLPAADADLDETIRQVRMGTLVVETTPGAAVRVEQIHHEFWFGAALSGGAFGGRINPEERAKYQIGRAHV